MKTRTIFCRQNSAIAPVQLFDLREREIVQRQPRPDIEGRQVDVGDEQAHFRGAGEGKREARPGAGRVEGAFVVPGAKEAEYFLAERAGKQAVYFIQAPDEGFGKGTQHTPPQIPFQIHVRPERGVPVVAGQRIEIELHGKRNGKSEVKRVERAKLLCIDLLEIRHDHTHPGLSRPLQSARHQAGLCRLAARL